MEINNFRKLISQIQQSPGFYSWLLNIQEAYLVKVYKITQLNTNGVIDLFKTLQKKFYFNRKTSNQESWYENELRIFVWLLFAYIFVFDKRIEDLNEEDWKFFSPIFNFKSTIFFEFQSQTLFKSAGRPAFWSEQETLLLACIMRENEGKNKWNSIARELFVRSKKRFFRNPKQCRQRWINHLDPKKIHSEWTISEDLTLLNCVRRKGKRWSIAMKQLENTRTEHMVKNRYKSLISSEARKHPGKKECQLESLLIKRLSKLNDKQIKDAKQQLGRNQQHEEPHQTSPNIKQQDAFGLQILKFDQIRPFQTKQDKDEGYEAYEKVQENLNQGFSDFDINSPIFIKWTGNFDPFDIREDRSRSFHQNEQAINLSDSDQLRI